jgi:hypothetical protein
MSRSRRCQRPSSRRTKRAPVGGTVPAGAPDCASAPPFIGPGRWGREDPSGCIAPLQPAGRHQAMKKPRGCCDPTPEAYGHGPATPPRPSPPSLSPRISPVNTSFHADVSRRRDRTSPPPAAADSLKEASARGALLPPPTYKRFNPRRGRWGKAIENWKAAGYPEGPES